ncbi:MAG: hypothetical protein R3E79_00590 [Caldilineaceae bacterium]
MHSFTGSHHYTMDYLTEEVLQRLPRTVEAFLLQTSILARLTASLCDAVTGTTEAQSILLQLERANLFLIPWIKSANGIGITTFLLMSCGKP